MCIELLEARQLLTAAPIDEVAGDTSLASASATISASPSVISAAATTHDDLLYVGIADGATSPTNAGLVMTADVGNGLVAPLHANLPLTDQGLSGLAFVGGKLLASTSTGLGSTSNLVQLDTSTGAQLSNTPITDGSQPISMGDLAIQPGTNTLYGIRSAEDGLGHSGALYIIDPNSGAASLVGDTLTGHDGGLAFSPGGTLYLAGINPATSQPTLFTLQSSTAQVLSSVSLSRPVDGLDVRSDGVIYGADALNGNLLTIDPTT
ncbi:MAG TPA: hypothetical protein VHV08_14775, partial [Pirellulales bacterium]|nr:hypothetical protein [Pirellulales bacterium]